MNKQEKSSLIQKIDRKWVKECRRSFSYFPGILRSGILGEEETWLELAQFYRDDLRWLLSLDHHIFWSHMIYSESANELLLSFLKNSVPNCMKRSLLVREDMINLLKEIEHLIFLVFLRLSTEKESASGFVRNFREIIYNNYLFTVPVILDICLIYGASNPQLVRKMINNVISSAPDFLDDFQEIIPQFVQVLKKVENTFLGFHNTLKENANLKSDEAQDLVLYLHDTVATIQIFFELYPNVCQLFSKIELVSEIVHFYSNVVPEVVIYWSVKSFTESFLATDLLENIRIDLLKIVKTTVDFVLNESKEIQEKKEDSVNEYLSLVSKFILEPCFLADYNVMYSVEFEIESAISNCANVDLLRVNQILEEVALALNEAEGGTKESFLRGSVNVADVKFDSLVTEVKDIFPHLEENHIKQYLSYYNNDTEKVVAAVLENVAPLELNENPQTSVKSDGMLGFSGKHKTKHENLNELLDDREEISKMKEKYMRLSFVVDETYDDEYDDTYDEVIEVPVRDGEDAARRPFVVPRVLRAAGAGEEDSEEEEEEEEAIEGEGSSRRDEFVQNPAVLRERWQQRRSEGRAARDVRGRGRGRGQSKQVTKNRDFKESHKSQVANHNRKKQAGRKMARGMIPS